MIIPLLQSSYLFIYLFAFIQCECIIPCHYYLLFYLNVLIVMHLCIYLRQKNMAGWSKYAITLFPAYAVISYHLFLNSSLDFLCPTQESHLYIQQTQVWIPQNYIQDTLALRFIPFSGGVYLSTLIKLAGCVTKLLIQASRGWFQAQAVLQNPGHITCISGIFKKSGSFLTKNLHQHRMVRK